MDSHVGLDYIVDNPDYCVKLASGKPSIRLPIPQTRVRVLITCVSTGYCSAGNGMPVREEAGRRAAVGAMRLQSGRQAEGHRYSPHIPGDYRSRR